MPARSAAEGTLEGAVSPTHSSRAARHQPQPTGEVRGAEGAAEGELHERSHLHPTCPAMGLHSVRRPTAHPHSQRLPSVVRSLLTPRCAVTGAGAGFGPQLRSTLRNPYSRCSARVFELAAQCGPGSCAAGPPGLDSDCALPTEARCAPGAAQSVPVDCERPERPCGARQNAYRTARAARQNEYQYLSDLLRPADRRGV